MEDFMNLLPWLLIAIMVFYLISQLKKPKTTASKDTENYDGEPEPIYDDYQDAENEEIAYGKYATAEEIFKTWSAQSKAYKAYLASALLTVFAVLGLLIYLTVAGESALDPIVSRMKDAFNAYSPNATTQSEMIAQAINIMQEMVITISIVFLAFAHISTFLYHRAIIDFAKWLRENDVDCPFVLNKPIINRNIGHIFSAAYVITQKPAQKKMFYIELAVRVVLSALTIGALINLFSSFITMLFLGSTGVIVSVDSFMTSFLTSGEAIIFYALTVAIIIINVATRKIWSAKKDALLRQNNARADEVDEE